MTLDLPLAWAVLILFSVMMYVVMDGFDLGIGILYPFFPRKLDRDIMMETVAPVWDGNETWLVLGGAGLFVAFPTAYAAILSALYLPLILMLIGLIFRGVAFEFRFRGPASHGRMWDFAFAAGSYVATCCQGVILGAYLEGVPARQGSIALTPNAWFTPFPLFVGCGLVIVYALLGATWLIMKTDGELQRRLRMLSRPLTGGLLVLIAAVSVWTPLSQSQVAARWFTWPNALLLAPVPILVLVCAGLLRKSLRDATAHAAPFLFALAVVFLGYLGLGISLWPNVLPPSTSIWEAAGPDESLGFTIVGALVIVPVILGYTSWGYWVFRGKVTGVDGHH